MLRGLIICPDTGLTDRFEAALEDLGLVTVTRKMDHYPSAIELLRYLRAHAPQIIFLSVASLAKAMEVASEVEKNTPGVQIFAINDICDPQLLLELMRAGIREFGSLPFDRYTLRESLDRVADALKTRPPEIDVTDQVFSFLPSKAGVGTSTIALNAAMALSRLPNANVLLSDFDLNSGMIRFMLKLDNGYSVIDAAEHSIEMDESLWPQMITPIEGCDILHAGKINPDYRMEASQLRHLLEFMRRNYRTLCFDLSGNLEKYSLELMHESKRIFLVCTPEIPSLHLAREKYLYLRQLDLADRVSVLLTRCQKRPLITPQQIEQLLGLPVLMTFPNDYQGVHRALTFGRWVEVTSEFGKQCAALAHTITQDRAIRAVEKKSKVADYFSIIPGKTEKKIEKKTAV
jgi:pilus assembly protein CpaE